MSSGATLQEQRVLAQGWIRKRRGLGGLSGLVFDSGYAGDVIFPFPPFSTCVFHHSVLTHMEFLSLSHVTLSADMRTCKYFDSFFKAGHT